MSLTESEIKEIENSILKKLKKLCVAIGITIIVTITILNAISIKTLKETNKEVQKQIVKISNYIEEAK